MTSRTTTAFWKCYRGLSLETKKEAKKAYKAFRKDPYRPSIHFKRVHSTRPIFSLRVTKDYRAIGIQQDKQIIWFRIGFHSDYDNLLKQVRTL